MRVCQKCRFWGWNNANVKEWLFLSDKLRTGKNKIVIFMTKWCWIMFCIVILHLESKFQQNCYFWTFLAIFGYFSKGPPFEMLKIPFKLQHVFRRKKKSKFFVHFFARVSTYLYFSRPILIIPSLHLKFQLEMMISEGVARMDRQTDRQTHRQTDSCAFII